MIMRARPCLVPFTFHIPMLTVAVLLTLIFTSAYNSTLLCSTLLYSFAVIAAVYSLVDAFPPRSPVIVFPSAIV